MRPIDYAIKMIVAYNMDREMFIDIVEELYYEDDSLLTAVLEELKLYEPEALSLAQDFLNHLG